MPLNADEPTAEVRLLGRLIELSLPADWRAQYWERWLSPVQRKTAAATYFVLGTYGEREKDWKLDRVEHFVTHVLGRLVGQLSRRTERRQVMYQGQVRGRILWPASFKARYTENHDPTRFVCQEVQRLYDTRENQLLKYMVHQITMCLTAVPESIRTGFCLRRGRNGDTFAPAKPRLNRIESALRIFGEHPSLREVTLPDRIGAQHLLSAESASLTEYAQVALFYRRYRDLVLAASWEQVAAVGQRDMPLPGPTSRDGLWLQLGAAVFHTARIHSSRI